MSWSRNVRRNQWLSLPAMCLLVAGCTATGPTYTDIVPDDPANAIVVIYRPKPPQSILFPVNSHQYFISPSIYHEDELVADLKVNAYTYVEVQPGLTTISAKDTNFGIEAPLVDLEIEANAGQVYYLRYEMRMSSEAPAVLKIMPVALAKEEIGKARYTSAAQ